jgi:hypothetical protein
MTSKQHSSKGALLEQMSVCYNNLTPGSLLTPAKWAISLERQDRYGFFRVHKRGKPHLTQGGGLTPITLDSRTWNPGYPIGLSLEDNPEDILLDIEGQHLRFQKDDALDGALAAIYPA